MTPFDPRLPIIAAEARVKSCHVFHCFHARREMGAQFHVAAFAQFAGLEDRHVLAIIAALESHDVLPAKRQVSSRGARLPLDWAAPQDWLDWASSERRWPPEDVLQEAAAFADYWQAKSGKDACKLDWRKTWQNWCRNSRRPTGDYRPVDNRRTPQEWAAFCEERLRWAKDKDYRQGVQEWQEKLDAARLRLNENVIQLRAI